LARGEIQCIGATTLDEYRKYIEKDGALERRFQQIIVNPPSKKETVEILRGLRDRYEAHHRVQIKDEALESAVELSDRYISGRCLPDKAIDVIDEAGARVRLKAMTRPPDLKELDAQVEQLNQEKEAAVANQEFERAAGLRDQADKLKKRKETLLRDWRERSKEVDGVVDDDVINEVVSKMTGVPLVKIGEDETKRLLSMEEELHKQVVSQHEPIVAISRAVRKSRAGIKDPKRPIGSFIFAGPTGVGKTLLAKRLAAFMFGDENALVQIDMSEYMEKHNVSRLIGAPPGYIGYEEGGQLTEKIRRRPYSVILLDEIEKAHPDVWNMLLQIMEEGRLTDNVGRVVDFKNTILIMTTNIGAEEIQGGRSLNPFRKQDEETTYEVMKAKLKDVMKNSFRPEFLNRVDDIIVFRGLGKDDIKQIIDIELEKVSRRLADKGLKLILTDEAKDLIIEEGYSKEYGARPLRRAIEHLLEDPLSEDLLRGTFQGKDTITVRVADAEGEPGKKRLFFDATSQSRELVGAK
jgi:ATP-dependent Clp protease ATP-binding subunit ClpC